MHFFQPLLLEWQRLISPDQDPSSVLFWLFAAVLLIQLLFYWVVFVRLSAFKLKDLTFTADRKPVSVIIAARDEYLNLLENLPAILEQKYPKFEVIVVNNDSTDDSATLLKNFQLQYPHLKVITLERNLNFFKGKKFPLSLGIKAARYEVLLFTDADCAPSSPNWIDHMQSAFAGDTGIVLGVGHYSQKPGLLNLLIRYETFSIAQQYLSWAMAGMAYMGVGRNLAYKKSLFLSQKGFISHYRVAGGDDDLFVNRASDGTRIQVQIHPDAQTFSRPASSFRKYFIQKRRHLSTARYYRPVHKFVLGLFATSLLLFWSLFFILFAMKTFLLITSIAFLLRWISQVIINKTSGKKIGVNILFLFSPFLELLLLLVQTTVFTVNIFSKPKRWK